MLRKFVKRVLTISMILLLCSGGLLSSVGSVVFADDSSTSAPQTNGNTVSTSRATKSDGSANGRVSTYINFAAGKTLDKSIIKDLNTQQLRFMGVFLSNFYTPWMTDLGNSSDKTSKVAQDNMSKALSEYAGFDESVSKTFSSYLQGISRASSKELKVKFKSKQSDSKFNTLPDSKYFNLSVTYADLLFMASGYAYSVKGNPEYKGVLNNKYGQGDYRYAYFGFDDGKGFKPVFGFDTQAKDNTASYVAFLKAMEMVDTEKGYGFAALDFKDGEIDVSGDGFKKLLETIGEKQLSESSIYGAKLRVDAFGNLLWMGKNHQYVILPGAMNPFTWQRIDGKGKDYGKAGNALNIANAQLLAHINQGSLGTPHPDKDKGTYYLNPKANQVFPQGDAHLADLRMVVGSSVTDTQSLSDNIAGLFGIESSPQDRLFELIQGQYKKDRGISDSDKSWKMYTPYYAGEDPINIMGGVAGLDNLGAYGFKSDTGDSKDDSYGNTDDGVYNAIQKLSLINSDGSFVKDFGKASTASATWGNSYKETKNQGYAKLDSSGTAKEIWKYLYVTYALAGLNEGKFAGGDNLGYRLNWSTKSPNLPEITGESINLSKQDENDSITKSIRDWLYYLLHPTDGFAYFVTWITNKVNHFILSWHNDMAGTEGVGVLPGTSRYIGFSGYVTTPELSDMQWTDAMVKWYQSIIIYLVIGFFVVMMAYVILGVLTFQKAILGLMLFSVMAYAPIIAVGASVNLSNRFANLVFGNKFAYWGIVQQQAYFADLADSIDSKNSTYQNYLLNLYRENAKESRNQGKDNMVLRWQAPKKMANLVLSNNEEKTYSDSFKQVIKAVTNGKNSGESFVENTSATYMYRSYTDLANVSMFMYGDFVSNGKARENVDTGVSATATARWGAGLKSSWSNFSTTYLNDRKEGYATNDSDGSNDGSQAYRVRLPLAGNIYSDAADVAKHGSIKNLKLGQYVGLDQRYFKFSIAQLNTNQDLISELSSEGFDASAGGKYTNEDIKSLAAYGVMSENPFYYFSWSLYDQGLASNPNNRGGFRDLLLSKSNSGYFYNTERNNEMRDYLDMRSMFTYLIPYLKQGNDLVREWDKNYGIFFYDGVTYEEGHEKDPEIANNPELAQKYWHNVNVARLYNIYTPWVDLMYDTSYAKPEKVSFQGQSYQINDPLNPASYPKERPMVFSKSEMYDYGLSEDQLTQVERKIMKISEKTMARWFDLLNYYNFTDVALNTSAAMEANFIFNQEFSETKVVGKSINLYPQSFELKNFTYDAFLRMIIANSTGESLTADEGQNGSLYERVMKNSSLTTGIFLLILDVLAIYAIPLIKVIIIIALFVSSILVIIIAALSVDESIGKTTVKKVVKAVSVPAIGFLGVSVAMSWAVSKFMGSGNTSVTGSTDSTVVLGDPAMTILAMMILNIVVFIAYWKVLRTVWGTLRKYGGTIFNHIGGILAGAALTGAAALGIGGKILKGATEKTVTAGKNIAKGTASTAKAIDGRVGITNKGSQRAQRRAEEKAQLRQNRKDYREAKRSARKDRFGMNGFNAWMHRHETVSTNQRRQAEKRRFKERAETQRQIREERKEERKNRNKGEDK